MLSAFPQLLNYSFLAIAGLRIFFGFWFLLYAYNTLFNKETQDGEIPKWQILSLAGLSILTGVLAVIGLFTQIAVLLGIFALLVKWYLDTQSKKVSREIFIFGFYIAIIGLALLFIGPGAYSLDLPL